MDDEFISEEDTIADERADDAKNLGSAIMRRPIRDLPSLRSALCVAPGTTVGEAIETMNEHRVGCLLVAEKVGRLVGVFTERDVLTRIATRKMDLARMRVDEVMTRDPECLSLDDGIAYALNKMSVGGFRHIPLVDAQGRPTGVVSMRDIVDYIVDLFPTEVLNLPPNPLLGISRAREGA